MPLLENWGYRLSIEVIKATVTWKIEPNISQRDFIVIDADKFTLHLFVCQLLLNMELSGTVYWSNLWLDNLCSAR